MATDRLSIRTSVSPESKSSWNRAPLQSSPKTIDTQSARRAYVPYMDTTRNEGLSNANGHSHDEGYQRRRSSERRDSRNESLPDTPPYQGLDAPQRPRLPPLKSLLGDNLSSPPPTPNATKGTMQPSPFEPSVSADTYKPLAFYPNKKQKTEYRLEPVAPIMSSGYFDSPSLPQPLFDRSPHRRPTSGLNGVALNGSGGGRSHASTSHSRERIPTFQPDTNGDYRANLYRVGLPYGASHASPKPYHRRRSYDQVENEREAVPPPRQGYSPSRPAYAQYHHERPSSRFDPSPEPQRYHPDDKTDVTRPRRDITYSYQSEILNRPPAHPVPASHHPSSSYFISNHYEHPHGKSRKRSNLPKQSTEIMRQWFEANISNPYPTEEQKAIFSNATGISMTQVSNWFINHRRRCPQLRDKRDRNRDIRDCDG